MRRKDSQLVWQGAAGAVLLAMVLLVVMLLLGPARTITPLRTRSGDREADPSAASGNLAVFQASAVLAAYERNEVEADEGLKGKWFAVSGRIAKIGKDLIGDPYVTLDCGGDSIFSVQCCFAERDASRLARLRPGERITIAGIGAGKMGNVLLRSCRFYAE